MISFCLLLFLRQGFAGTHSPPASASWQLYVLNLQISLLTFWNSVFLYACVYVCVCVCVCVFSLKWARSQSLLCTLETFLHPRHLWSHVYHASARNSDKPANPSAVQMFKIPHCSWRTTVVCYRNVLTSFCLTLGTASHSGHKFEAQNNYSQKLSSSVLSHWTWGFPWGGARKELWCKGSADGQWCSPAAAWGSLPPVTNAKFSPSTQSCESKHPRFWTVESIRTRWTAVPRSTLKPTSTLLI
jgi:hypothetical protein